MNNRTLLLAGFLIMVLAQLAVPATMIIKKELLLNKATKYKFKTRPVDPNDPFRGKYITLDYEERSVFVDNQDDWEYGDAIFVTINNGADGYAKIENAYREKPDTELDYVSATIGYSFRFDTNQVAVTLPFDRYYMDEGKAQGAEDIYWDLMRDSTRTIYAIVAIKDGESVLKDVMVNDESIKDLVESKY